MNDIELIGHLPTVFISSTCYDLKQIRTALKDYIEVQLGFDAMLSEYDSFPLDTSIGTVENCIRAVRARADIFVLVVGRRYGSITDDGRSVTNLEYISARAKGIPIYTFVEKELLSILPIWKTNPTADFSSTVDTSKLFEFVDALCGKENIWVYSFEYAHDIIHTLKKQIGYLLYDSLKIWQQVRSQRLSAKIMHLEGDALKIALEKPTGWEYLLFGKVMENCFNKAEDLKKDLLYGIFFGHVKVLEDKYEIINWITTKNSELLLVTGSLAALFHKAIPLAMGEPGKPGDADYIIYVAERLGSIYEEIIKWGLGFKSISVPEEWQSVLNSLEQLWKSPISDLDKYCEKYRQAMNVLIIVPEESDESLTLDLSLTLSEPDFTVFNQELNKIRQKYSLI